MEKTSGKEIIILPPFIDLKYEERIPSVIY